MNFLDKYDNLKNIRFDSFKFALEETFTINLKFIVKTDQQILLSFWC